MKKHLVFKDGQSPPSWAPAFRDAAGTLPTASAGVADLKPGVSISESQSSPCIQVLKAHDEGTTLCLPPPDWSRMTLEALRQALIDHFAYLVDSPGYEAVLHLVMNEAVEAHDVEGQLEVRFQNDFELAAEKPLDDVPDLLPPTFRHLLLHHRRLVVEQAGLILGDHDLATWVRSTARISDRKVSVDPGPMVWPREGCGGAGTSWSCNPGSLFLLRLAEAMSLKVPELQDAGASSMEAWWEGLDDAWRTLLAKTCRVHAAPEASRCHKLETLILDRRSHITSLAPLGMLKGLRHFACHCPDVHDFTPLSALVHLRSLTIGSPGLHECSALAGLTNLESLSLAGTCVRDLAPLASLHRLRELDLRHCPVQDLAPLGNLEHLSKLNLRHTAIRDLKPQAHFPALRFLDVSATDIQTCVPLAGVLTLTSLDVRCTQIPSLEPLGELPRLRTVFCHKTPVSFEDVLRFESRALRGREHGHVNVYSDFQELKRFVAAMEQVDFPLEGLEGTLAILVKQNLGYALTSKDPGLLPRLLKALARTPALHRGEVARLVHEALASIEQFGLEGAVVLRVRTLMAALAAQQGGDTLGGVPALAPRDT